MPSIVALAVLLIVMAYSVAYAVLLVTQSKKEPRLLPTVIPFLDPALGIARDKVDYLVNLKNKYHVPIFTMRMPFQRSYVVNAPQLIQAVQAKANLSTFVPTLLDFGIMFSGLNKDSQRSLRSAFDANGNAFTISVHRYLNAGSTLVAATRTAIDKLAASVPNNFLATRERGLLETVRHDLTLALTGAIYGPENPFGDPKIEHSWIEFVPGISHLLYSPFPRLTANSALRARTRVIDAFKNYFGSGGHLQAFPMVAEMFERNRHYGLTPGEAAKMEMATSLAMLSSGAITAFWLLFHILSDPDMLHECRQDLLNVITNELDTTTCTVKVVDVSLIKTKCPTIMAMLQESLRYHSTVINVKKVQHDVTLASEYNLKKGGIVMIPGTAVHHDTSIWGPSATTFDHRRFFTAEGHKKLGNTCAYRPFGAGATMCPGRHFSTNVTLSFVAMVLLQFDIESVEGWRMPTKKQADLWNAMPKPDWDPKVKIALRTNTKKVEWKFVWGSPENED